VRAAARAPDRHPDRGQQSIRPTTEGVASRDPRPTVRHPELVMKNPLALAVAVVLLALPARAAVGVVQAPNPYDRHFERLPDLRLVRGARPRAIALDVTAAADEAWTIAVDASWATLTPTSGTGPARVRLSFDADALNALSDPTATLTVTGADSTATLGITWDIWPKVIVDEQGRGGPEGRADLVAYAKDRGNWPRDGFEGGWELWGFLPDPTTHPARLSAPAPVDAPEATPCAPGQTTGCTREGQAGLTAGQSADQAWLLSTGDFRVTIGVLDSGIKWDASSLVNKFYVNASELASCPPPGADTAAADPFVGFDVNGDGLFNIRDYDDAAWLDDVNLNGRRDPQDLIWADDGDGACSDGIDNDNNGYVDDISGWDFFWNDNDPSDDSDYGHGTGEANDAGAEAHDDDGTPGVCPRCSILNVRVGDSFVVDVNQFADAVVFVVDSGADVVQEALGSINNTPYAQKAIDYAYFHNVPIVASAADETSYHHNFPGILEHTLYVHAIVHDEDNEFTSSTFLNFNNCTNFGGHLVLSTPGEGCSSEATGKTAGQTGLLMSYWLQQRDRAQGTADAAYFAAPLSAEEIYQTLIASADDIDVEGAEADPAAKELRKFPSNEGWDLHFGWGRNNARRALELVRDKRVPPEVNVSQPRWFDVFDPDRTPTFDVRANVSSPRLTALRWELFVAERQVGAPLTKVAEGQGPVGDSNGADGLLATIDIARDLPGMLARAGDPAGSDPEQFSGVIEVHAFGTNPAGEVIQGKFRKTFGVRRDPSVMPGFPIYLGASGESSPKLTDLDGDGTEEIVVATADGLVHAIAADTNELPGFPVALDVYAALNPAVCAVEPAKCHRNSAAFREGTAHRIVPEDVRTSTLATVAIGDLDGDGAACRDLVVATLDGLLYAFDCAGTLRAGFPVTIDRSTTTDGLTGARRCERDGQQVIGCRDEQLFAESGFFSSPLLVDLDADGSLEVVIGGLDSRAYAWHLDGRLVNGWPVHLVNEAEPAYLEGEPNRLDDRIIASPTVADLFGDGTPWLVMGTNERKKNSNQVYLYAIHPQGTARAGGPFPSGWPTKVDGFIPDEILPYVGRGNPNSPCAADFDGDGDDEIVNAGMGGNMLIIDGTGIARAQAMRSLSGDFGPNETVDEEANRLMLPVINNPSVADLDGDGTLDIINGTAGTGLIAVASEGGKRSDFDHSVSAWISANGYFQDGFPRRVWDYQFFMNYAVADVDGDGQMNVLSGDGGYFVYATNNDGSDAKGFPKWTQGWHIGTPAVGDLDGDERIEVVANTREGWLWAWKTEGHVRGPKQAQPAIQWEGFHRDDQNTGNASGRFAALKRYAPLLPPDDAAGGCGCAQSQTNPGALAGLALLATLTIVRRRRRN
jgi:MYXO-CTERM domain-containing protein